MAEGALMICMIELSGIVAKEGLHQYLEHRKYMFESNRQDELISSKIKSLGNNIYKKMSRSSTPIKEHFEEDDIPIDFDNVYNDEKSDEDIDKNQKLSVEKIISEMPKLEPKKYKKSTLGFNMDKIKKILKPLERAITPVKKEIDNDFDIFVKDIATFLVNEFHCQKNIENASLQKHKHLTMKLIKTLEINNKNRKISI
jgi:hypothetical protein